MNHNMYFFLTIWFDALAAYDVWDKMISLEWSTELFCVDENHSSTKSVGKNSFDITWFSFEGRKYKERRYEEMKPVN